MLRHPLNEDDFSFSKWQPSSTIALHSMDSQTDSLSLSQLGSRPFDLISAIMTPTDSSHKNKYPRIATQLDEEQLSTPTSTTDDDQSMTDTHELITTSNNTVHDCMDNLDQNMDEDDIWTMFTTAADTDTSTGLLQQTQLRSWDDDTNNKTLSEDKDRWTQTHSPYLTESSGYMEALYQTKFPDAPVVENERLIKDVINLLTGIPSLCFEWKNDKKIFQIRETGMRLANMSPGLIQRILQPMVVFGTRMKMLEDLTAYIQSHPNLFGSIAVSFACCLGELLSYLQHSIVSLFTQSPSSSNQHTQLLEIHHRMEGFFFIMRHLANLCTMKTSKSQRWMVPRGGELLTLLYNKILDLDDFHMGYNVFLKAIYMTLLINTSIPWLAMLTQWLNHGVIHDPYQDFFIIHNEHNKLADKKRTGMTIDTSALPCFLPKSYAKMVLRAGMVILGQKVDPIVLDEFCISWLDSSPSSNLEHIIHQHISAEATPYPFNSPPTLSTLSDPDTYLQQKQSSVCILGEYMSNNQNNDYTPPLPIFLRQQLLDPIQQRHQLVSSLSDASSTARSSSSSKSMGPRNMLFTYWNGHSDQYPTTFYTDLVTPPFKISAFLDQQRHHHTTLSSPSPSPSSSSSSLSNSIN